MCYLLYRFDPTGPVSLPMPQDLFSPHDDMSWLSLPFFPRICLDLFFLHRTVLDLFLDPSCGTDNDTFACSSSFSDENSSFVCFGDFQIAEDRDGPLTPTSGIWWGKCCG